MGLGALGRGCWQVGNGNFGMLTNERARVLPCQRHQRSDKLATENFIQQAFEGSPGGRASNLAG